MSFSTKYAKENQFIKRFKYREDNEDIPIAVSIDGEYEEGEGYNLSEYEIRWYCYRCNELLRVKDDSVLSLKSSNFDIVEDDNGDPRMVERIIVKPSDKEEDEIDIDDEFEDIEAYFQ
ncbi:MAG: hypothetical protein WA941_05270 [Nitrososphaeraceae archaeon]